MASTRRGLRRWLRILAVTAFLVVGVMVIWQASRWPDVAGLTRRNPTSTAFIEAYKTRERAAGREPRVAWAWVGYGAVSPARKRPAGATSGNPPPRSPTTRQPSSRRRCRTHARGIRERRDRPTVGRSRRSSDAWRRPRSSPHCSDLRRHLQQHLGIESRALAN